MSDRQEPENPAGDSALEMPTAGRRPASVTGPIGRPIPRTASSPDDRGTEEGSGSADRAPGPDASSDGAARAVGPRAGSGASGGPADEETRSLSRPGAEETRALSRPGAEETRALSRPGAEETRPLRRPAALDDGETRVLKPPPATGAGELSAAETLNLDDGPTLERERPATSVEAAAGEEPTRRLAPADGPAREGERPATGDDAAAGAGPARRLASDDGSAGEDEPTERLSGKPGDWFGPAADGGVAESSPERVAGVRGRDDAGASGGGDRLVQKEAPEKTAGTAAASAGGDKPAKRKVTSAGALIWVLLLLLGYTLVVQLRSNNDDQGLATARQEDLVSILSDLESRDSRLQTEIQSLETSQRQLTSGVTSRQAALSEAEKRAGELGLLAGTLPGKGPGLKITIDKVKASEILNAVQELRGSGGEVMELAGADGTAVRIVASSYFVDAEGGGIDADGTRLMGPWTLWVIGPPQTMQTALQIQGGVVASITGAGGSVTMESQTMVEVTAVRKAGSLQYAKPTS